MKRKVPAGILIVLLITLLVPLMEHEVSMHVDAFQHSTTKRPWSPSQVQYIESPDGLINASISVENWGALTNAAVLRMRYRSSSILDPSLLGLGFSGYTHFLQDLKIENVSRSSHNSTWEPLYGERDTIRDRYEQMTITLRETSADNRTFRILVRAYDEGLAFRYYIPKDSVASSYTISTEYTRFVFRDYIKGYEEDGTEGVYKYGNLSGFDTDFESPLTIVHPKGHYLSIMEANLTDHSRMGLSSVSGDPKAVRVKLRGQVSASGSHTTPWRVIMTADSPGELIENNFIVENLNEPCAIDDTSWIRPGVAFRDCTLTETGAKANIDMAVDFNMSYIELDAGWYGNEWGGSADPTKPLTALNLSSIISYGKQRGIGVILYVNWRHYKTRISSLPLLYSSWGIKGVKLGFVDGDSQSGINGIHNAVKYAAQYKLIVDVHDNYRPTGWSRTYPNFLTQEGVRGCEHKPNGDHNTLLPFVRYQIGAADYTPMYYSGSLITTYAHRIATPIVFYSPLQFLFWYAGPASYRDETELDLWKDLRTVWNETLVLDGSIGDHCVIARRSYGRWMIGALSDGNTRYLTTDLPFLEDGINYTMTMVKDGSGLNVVNGKYIITSRTVITERANPHGGFAIKIEKSRGNELNTLPFYNFTISPPDHRIATVDVNYSQRMNSSVPPDQLNWSLETNGTWLKMEGDLLYGTPDETDVGSIWVNVTAETASGDRANVNFTMNVTPYNFPPKIITEHVVSCLEDSPYDVTYAAVDHDSDPEKIMWNFSTDAGFLCFNRSTARLFGTPDNYDVGNYTVNISVTDGSDYTNDSFHLEVINTNDPPKIVMGARYSTLTGDVFNVTLTAYDIDPTHDNISWTLNDPCGFLSLVDGIYLVGLPDENHIGIHHTEVCASDGLDSDSLTLTIIVNDRSGLPNIVTEDVTVCLEDRLYHVDYRAIDDETDEDMLIWHLEAGPSFLELNPRTGILRGVPGNEHVGFHPVSLYVTDGTGRDWANFTLTVQDVNDPPAIQNGFDLEIMEDDPLNFTFTAVDMDDEKMLWNVTTSSNWIAVEENRLHGTPGDGDVGFHRVRAKVSDGRGSSDEKVLTITVLNRNDPPRIVGTDITFALEDSAYRVVYSVDDPDDPRSTWNMTTDANWLSINDGILFGIPENDDVSIYSVNISVSDGHGGSDHRCFALEVLNVNDPPVITTENIPSPVEDTTYIFDLGVEDPDPLDEHVWSMISGPEWLRVEKSGRLIGTPGNDDTGLRHITLGVFDGNTTAYGTFVFDVVQVNDAPLWDVSKWEYVVPSGRPMMIRVSAYDPEGDRLTYSVNGDIEVEIDEGSGVLIWMEPVPGEYTIQVLVSDGNQTISEQFKLFVTGEEEDNEKDSGFVLYAIILVLIVIILALSVLLFSRVPPEEE